MGTDSVTHLYLQLWMSAVSRFKSDSAAQTENVTGIKKRQGEARSKCRMNGEGGRSRTRISGTRERGWRGQRYRGNRKEEETTTVTMTCSLVIRDLHPSDVNVSQGVSASGFGQGDSTTYMYQAQ